MYADDVIIFAESPAALQIQINKLYDYCMTWKLCLNTKKSQIVVFKRGNHPCQHQWYYGENPIQVNSRIPYLGMVFTSNGLFSQTQTTLADQANKALFQLYKILATYRNLNISVAIDLFDKFITPILNYSCEVWGFHAAPDIERVHLGFLKRLLGVKKTTQNDFVYGILGRYPMGIQRQCRIVKYWVKIVSGCKSPYINILYSAAVAHMGNDHTFNWASKVKHLLNTTGFGDIWLSQGVNNPDAFILAFQQRVHDIYKQGWNARLLASPRARFYRNIITEHGFYKQLDMLQCKTHRTAITQLIVSSHRLGVETGRWDRPQVPYERRLCPNCQKLDDEYHFLLECSKFMGLRENLIPRYYSTRPSMFKCAQMLSSINRKNICQVAKYVYKAFCDIR